ncbi:hypothetical protein DP939_16300 [Spongiactinospora rosea]|uniref:Uncharacterized protein n=1 Tax=Spongiactinospora rosea TaxID=2248750 RepID=A0A366LXX7_9ACTN|nr:hypothetical protein [Spongiactinospora rosea]RBQ18781.1 hypothetical protein DP939_16300 [Spongiactinospora rosea]
MIRWGRRVTLAGLSGGGAVLARTDVAVGAYLNAAALRWLKQIIGSPSPRGAFSPAQRSCLRAWASFGLVEVDGELARQLLTPGPEETEARQAEPAAASPGALIEAAAALPPTGAPVLAVGVGPGCMFCEQLAADLTAAVAGGHRPGVGVVLSGDGHDRVFGPVPAHAVAGLAALARASIPRGTPSGVLLRPGAEPRPVIGYDQVTAVLTHPEDPDDDQVVVQGPSSCSVNVTSGAGTRVWPVRAGRRIVGVGARGAAAAELTGWLDERGTGGYAPITLTVERPKNLYLVYNGGGMIARLRSTADTVRCLETVLDAYAAQGAGRDDEADVSCGALWNPDHGVVLVPNPWTSELTKRSTRLGQAGWRLCPAPYVRLSAHPDRAWAHVHPLPDGPRTAPVAFRAEPPPEAAPGEPIRIPGGEERAAQLVCWAARPITEPQLHALAATAGRIPTRTLTLDGLITELTRP